MMTAPGFHVGGKVFRFADSYDKDVGLACDVSDILCFAVAHGDGGVGAFT